MKRLANKRVCSQERTETEFKDSLMDKLKKHKTNEVVEEKAQVEVEMDDHAFFDVLPNQMVELILLQHLHQPWHIVKTCVQGGTVSYRMLLKLLKHVLPRSPRKAI